MHLHIFPAQQTIDPTIAQIKIHTDAFWENEKFHWSFELSGLSPSVDWPQQNFPMTATHARRDFIYEGSCVELFLRRDRSYLEWNFDPKGAWCAYAFSDYRQRVASALTHSAWFPEVVFSTERKGEVAKVSGYVLPGPTWAHLNVETSEVQETHALTAVLKIKGQPTYWAAIHPRPDRADFHDARGHVAKTF